MIDFSKLQSIGGLDIVSNLALQNLSLPALTYSTGPMVMSGNFSRFAFFPTAKSLFLILSSILLPRLKVVKGSFQLSSATDFDCSAFDDDNEAGMFPIGAYSCTGHNTTSPTTSLDSTITVETKKPSSAPSTIPSTAVSSATPHSTLSATQSDNTSSTSTVPTKATNAGLTTKEKLAIGLGVGLATTFILTAGLFWWMIRASHKRHEDRISRVPILLTGNMLLDNVPERSRDPAQSRFGDPRYSGLSYYEVHTELEELHALEESRALTGLEKERERWLMGHMFLRAEPTDTVEPTEMVERVEMEG